ncbi:MAG: hypothetical protein IJN16_08870 [Lachnospiraceae bacterium]|nr:hypothetical protein [Lachnospiraceae bacterium]
MLNGDRIVLMTKLASYEKKEGKRCMAIGRYFRGDYVTLNILKAVISATIAFFIGLALYILYDIESLMENLYSMDLLLLAKNIISSYVIFVVVYCCLTYVIFTYRYAKAKKNIRRYQNNLKKLNAMYRQ